jgi:peroxiredoxin Q/BCP
MAQLRQDYQQIKANRAEILVVGPDSREAFQQYWTENNLPFIGLPDPKHHILKLYGQKVNLFKIGRMPAQVIVDRNGNARYVHYGHDMTDIPPTEEIINILDELNTA